MNLRRRLDLIEAARGRPDKDPSEMSLTELDFEIADYRSRKRV